MNVGGTQNVGRARRAARLLLDRLRLRRRQARALPRVRRARSARRLRPDASCTARRRRASRPGSSAPRGSSARSGHNFVRTMLRARRASATRSRSSTTSAAARPTPATSPRRSRELVELPFGVYHLAAGGRVHLGRVRRGDLRRRRGSPAACAAISTAEFGAKAPRPAYSVLRSEKGAPELPHWREGLRECLARLPDAVGQAGP